MASEAKVEFTGDGYLRLSRESAERFFPEDSLVALWRNGELFLLPTRGAAAGGLLLKQRNVNGDRSLLLSEVFQFQMPTGVFEADWHNDVGGLRINFTKRDGNANRKEPQECIHTEIKEVPIHD